eukprot:TRINITY_DN2965_c0_g1_i2.p1 TRINITY_DN2965_c0_g1~~TRINITY_DN2965_c0_g1_i2.p1  ORF type:complete len:503 (-),score=103.46 TRINITY_DN2965_c0_g1_i2:480-1988(-)
MARSSASQATIRRRPAILRTAATTVLAVGVASKVVGLAGLDITTSFTLGTGKPSSPNQLGTARDSRLDHRSLRFEEGQSLGDEQAGAVRQFAGFLAAAAAAVCVTVAGPRVELGKVWQFGPAPVYAERFQKLDPWTSLTGAADRANKDPISLLQLALPLEDSLGEDKVRDVRAFQRQIEAFKKPASLGRFQEALGKADDVLKTLDGNRKNLLKPAAASRQAQAEAALDELKVVMNDVIQDLKKADALEDKEDPFLGVAKTSPEKAQLQLSKFEELLLPPDFKPDVPKEYNDLPQLFGRATVEMIIKRGPDSGAKQYAVDSILYDKVKLKVVLDGWSAPISAGNFIELVDRGFYNGLKIIRADDLLVLSGDSGDADEHGFRPSPTAPVRRLPLEVPMMGRKALYGETADEARLVGQPPRLPFQAEGLICMARNEFENDTASSQFFFFLFDSDLTPAGKNFLDGRYATMGYTIEGNDFLRKIKENDIIESVKILDGLEGLKRPA